MGYDISAYVEQKKDGDKWVLVSERPISSRLKYIIDDYKDFNDLNWDDLSDGLKGIFKKDEDGKVYHNFYVARIEDIEAKIAGKIKESYVRLNTIVKAMGCQRFQSDDGEELEPWGDDEDKEKLVPEYCAPNELVKKWRARLMKEYPDSFDTGTDPDMIIDSAISCTIEDTIKDSLESLWTGVLESQLNAAPEVPEGYRIGARYIHLVEWGIK